MLTTKNSADRLNVPKPVLKPTRTTPVQQQQSQISEGNVADQRQKQQLRKQAEQQQLQMD